MFATFRNIRFRHRHRLRCSLPSNTANSTLDASIFTHYTLRQSALSFQRSTIDRLPPIVPLTTTSSVTIFFHNYRMTNYMRSITVFYITAGSRTGFSVQIQITDKEEFIARPVLTDTSLLWRKWIIQLSPRPKLRCRRFWLCHCR